MARTANAAATVPERCKILGTVLAPFCLGHHLLFSRLGMPFTDNPMAEFEREKMLEGIAICAGKSYETTLRLMLSWEWEGVYERWSKQLTGHWWKRRRVNWLATEALFRAYLADGYQKPPITPPVKITHSLTITAPWEVMLKCKLVMNGFAETDVLNGYLPGRWYDFYTVTEQLRAANCVDPKDWKRMFWTEEDERGFQAAGRMGQKLMEAGHE